MCFRTKEAVVENQSFEDWKTAESQTIFALERITV